MKQKVIQSIPSALTAGGLIKGGLTDLADEIGMNVTTSTEIAQKMTDLIMACGNHEQTKQTKTTRRSALVDAINNGRNYIRVVRDILKVVFGYEYSDSWTALGYKNSLALPDSVEDVIAMLVATAQFFTNNPTLEVAGMNVTAARAQALLDALTAAQNAFAAQDMAVETAVIVRDGKFVDMKRCIANVVKELTLRLDPLDPRWLRFGLNIPGADETPDTPEAPTATLIGPTAMALKWTAAARAVYYHVYKKVVGVDEDFVLAGSPADLDFTIEGLPANATVEIQISAVNSGGESGRTSSVSVVMHA